MVMQTEAKIYLAAQRGCSRSDWYRSFYTFNFESYSNENRKPLGRLRALNDETLGSGHTIRHAVYEDTTVVLLPVVGGLNYKTGTGEQGFLDAGQLYLFFASKGSVFEISNPYKNELINFIQIRFSADHPGDNKEDCKHEFDLDLQKNQLLQLRREAADRNLFFIGKFDGRKEWTHVLSDTRNEIFVFILEGAFEVQNRLLQPRDGLSIKGAEKIEFEALSNEAVILITEQHLSA
jgi:quercetin 2,3-dioxygenase